MPTGNFFLNPNMKIFSSASDIKTSVCSTSCCDLCVFTSIISVSLTRCHESGGRLTSSGSWGWMGGGKCLLVICWRLHKPPPSFSPLSNLTPSHLLPGRFSLLNLFFFPITHYCVSINLVPPLWDKIIFTHCSLLADVQMFLPIYQWLASFTIIDHQSSSICELICAFVDHYYCNEVCFHTPVLKVQCVRSLMTQMTQSETQQLTILQIAPFMCIFNLCIKCGIAVNSTIIQISQASCRTLLRRGF